MVLIAQEAAFGDLMALDPQLSCFLFTPILFICSFFSTLLFFFIFFVLFLILSEFFFCIFSAVGIVRIVGIVTVVGIY